MQVDGSPRHSITRGAIPRTAMVREVNIDSIRALEKQIEEHERAIIRLKRTRNSLLNVSTLLPPEILGNIFRWNVIPDGDFGGPPKGSYNFLLVCRHWFEVASRTPGLWSSWGASIGDWTRWHTRCRTGPVDLVLERCTGSKLDDELHDALQDCATRDAIRRVHLRGAYGAELLNSVISSIVIEGEETRSNSIVSFIVQNDRGSDTVDVSSFFSRYHLPKLQCLRLVGCRISSWDLLKSRTTALTTLELTNNPHLDISPVTSTLPQLVSILSSNPLLQDLVLSYDLVPHVDGGWPSPLVPLRHLKKLSLSGDFHSTFLLIGQLQLPDRLDSLDLSLGSCSSSDLSQTLGPYLRDRVRCRGRSPGGGLGLSATNDFSTFHFRIGDAKTRDSGGMVWFITVDAVMSRTLGREVAEQTGFNLIAHVPQRQVISLRTNLPILRSEELCIEMCNLTRLNLDEVDLSACFAGLDIHEPHKFEKLLPSLDRIILAWPTLSDDYWYPLVGFLSRRAAARKPISSVRFCGYPDIDDDAYESIRYAVKVFDLEGSGVGDY